MLQKKIIKILIFLLFISSFVKADEFFFEGNEILILEKGNKLKSENGAKITSSDDIIITSQNFEYDKTKNYLFLEKNVKINDKKNKTVIDANKIFYDRTKEEIISYGETKIFIDNDYIITTESIRFDRKLNIIFSETTTEIEDKEKNILISENIKFNINNQILKAKKVKINYFDGGKSFFESFFGNLNTKEFIGKDTKYYFNKNSFGNENNDPRLYGNILERNENKIVLSKGIFTTCKKRDGCPPWKMKAEKVTHDKEKKIIDYKNAWLEFYDKPILYFPKFFHPDPTVKRQSGFLIPTFGESGNSGSSVQIPYFKVISDNKDATFTPRIFTNKNILFQNEYRRVEKNSNHISDIGLFTSAASSDEQSSKSHFFSNTQFLFNDNFFEESSLEINLETVSNDTYLKKYNLISPLIKSNNTMHSFINFNGYSKDSSFSFEVEAYEDLSVEGNDRYQYIYPNISFSKDFDQVLNLSGDLTFSSNLFQKQYETNKYQQYLANEIRYSSNEKYFNTGVLTNFIFSLKNPNVRDKVGSENQSKSKNQLLTQLMYNMSYPLKKQSEMSNNIFTPIISFRYSPNMTKNLKDDDQRLDISNINSFDRMFGSDGVEGGQSATYGFEYKNEDYQGNEKINFELFQVIRDKKNSDLPLKTTLDQKYSDIIGRLKLNTSDNLNFQYNFMVDNNFEDTNLNSILAEIKVNNFVTSFEFLEERNLVGTKSYISNNTSLRLNNNNSITFATRKNKEIDLTEFYNLVYQYENDCLKAALEYNKRFYTDGDLKPEEELFFTLTIIPFSKINTANLN